MAENGIIQACNVEEIKGTILSTPISNKLLWNKIRPLKYFKHFTNNIL